MNEDRILGSLLGLAVGDALGTIVKFQARNSLPPVTDVAGSGAFGLAPGQWTDDTSMTLCITASLVETGACDPHDQLVRFVRQYRDGYLSNAGQCFNIDNQILTALKEFETTGEPYREEVGGVNAGNESLMRLAPVAMTFCDDPEAAGRFCADSPRTTHLTVECVEACGAYGRLIAVAIHGASYKDLYVLAVDLPRQVTSPELASVLNGSCRVKERDEILSSGYALHSLGVALWALARTDTFLDGVLLAVNLSDDADTVGATYGQLAGTLYGRSDIPENQRTRLHGAGVIEDLAAGIAGRVETFKVVAR